MDSDSRRLLLEITHCPIVDVCYRESTAHVCSDVVREQSPSPIVEFQVPEPWSGDLTSAPMLFLSSNPGINNVEEYPTRAWSDEEVVDFFANRFGGGKQAWVRDGLYGRRKDGGYAKGWVRFWAAVRARASELLNRDAIPGVDYALSEVVHCKSNKEAGVQSASTECVPRWLGQVLEASGAGIIICLGQVSANAVRSILSIPSGGRISRTLIGGRRRTLLFLPHPNSRQKRTIAACFSDNEIADLRAELARLPS